MAKDPSIKGEIKRFSIEFYSEKVLAELLEFPVSIRARCFLLLDRMKEDGPNLGFPYTRKIVGTEAIFEVRGKSKRRNRQSTLLHGYRQQNHRPSCLCQENPKDTEKRY